MSDLITGCLSGPWAQRIGWMLIHSFWQETLVAIMLGLTLRLLRHRSSQSRWLAACVALAAMAILPLLTAFLVPVRPRVMDPAGTRSNAAVATRIPSSLVPPVNATAGGESVMPPLRHAAGQTADSPVAAADESAFSFGRISGRVHPIMPWLLLAWLIGVCGVSLWHLGGWILLQRARRFHTCPVSPGVRRVFQNVVQRLRVSEPVQLLESASFAVPVVIGWLRPVILLPACAICGLAPAQLEAVLAHELAHIRRHDYLVGLIQAVVETLFFYHPAVWWASQRIRQESEYCCDEMALQACPDRQNYAHALLRIVELGARQPDLALAASGGKVLWRIQRILRLPVSESSWSARWMAGILVLACLLAGGSIMYHASAAQSVTRLDAKGDIGRALGADVTSTRPATQPATDWGQPLGGLAARLSIDKTSFKAGDPVPIHLVVRNASDEVRVFQRPTEPANSTLIVRDDRGRDVPYLDAPVQAIVPEISIGSHQDVALDPFDLAQWYYLRRPGKYTVSWPGTKFLLPGLGSVALPATPQIEFEIAANTAIAADGDPIGRLLPLVKQGWQFEAMKIAAGKLRPEGNWPEGPGWSFAFVYPSTNEKGPRIRLWLTDQPAPEQPAIGDPQLSGEYVGKISLWHVYMHIPVSGLKAWPGVKEEIRQALAADVAQQQISPVAVNATPEGNDEPYRELHRRYRTEIRAAAKAGNKEEIRKLTERFNESINGKLLFLAVTRIEPDGAYTTLLSSTFNAWDGPAAKIHHGDNNDPHITREKANGQEYVRIEAGAGTNSRFADSLYIIFGMRPLPAGRQPEPAKAAPER